MSEFVPYLDAPLARFIALALFAYDQGPASPLHGWCATPPHRYSIDCTLDADPDDGSLIWQYTYEGEPWISVGLFDGNPTATIRWDAE